MGRLPRDAPAKAEGLLRQLQRLRGLQKTTIEILAAEEASSAAIFLQTAY